MSLISKYTFSHFRSIKLCKKHTNFCNYDFCLVAAQSGFISTRQFSVLKFLLQKHLKKNFYFLSNITFPLSVSKKPIGVRLGKGKGKLCYRIQAVSPGQTICFVNGLNLHLLLKILKIILKNFHLKTFLRVKSSRWVL